MLKRFNKNKVLFTILCSIVIVVLLVTTITLAVTLSNSYELSNITVNGIKVTLNDKIAYVEIEQADFINITYEAVSNIQVCIYDDKDLSHRLPNFKDIEINGIDTTFYITTGKSNKIKKTYVLNIKNKIKDEQAIDFNINGAKPDLSDNEYIFTLSCLINELRITIEPSSFFSYSFYFDNERQHKIEDISCFTLPSDQNSIYLDIYNVNLDEIYKSHKINFIFIDNADGTIASIYVNGIKSEQNNTSFTVYVERANILSMDITIDENTIYEVYADENLSNTIDDIQNIMNLDLSGAPLNYYIKTTSSNGAELVYILKVYYVLDNNAEIKSMIINNTLAFVEDNEIHILIERQSYLNIMAECISPRAKISYYYDVNKTQTIKFPENIDISNCAEPVLQLFVLVIAESGAQKFYTVNVNFFLNNESELLDLRANNQTAIIEDSAASLQFIGTPNTVTLLIQSIRVSKYATFDVFSDYNCTITVNCDKEIILTTNHQEFYILITAEDKSSTIYTLTVNLISNDNNLKGITINNQEFIINEETSEFLVESSTRLQINDIKYDPNAIVGLFYDSLQTIQVTDLNNINFSNNIGQLYIRVVAETGDIKVFSITIIFKNAPTPVFMANSVQLSDWQKTISIGELFYMDCNSYNEHQFDYEVYWNNIKQNTDFISINNVDKTYTLEIIVRSPYFEDIHYSKSVEILPYTLTEVSALLIIDNYSTKNATEKINLNEVIALDSGSYVIGRDFYIEINYPNSTKQVVVDLNSQLDLVSGKYTFFINAFNNYFASKLFGELDVAFIEKDIPTINAPEFVEMDESNSTISIKDLFVINQNDYEIILVKTFVNNTEADSLLCSFGIYILKLQAYYSNGMIEKEIKVEIATKSDNTSLDVLINGELVRFVNNEIILPEINYNDDFTIMSKNYNSRSNISMVLNNSFSEFGTLNLLTGNNTIIITVVAESGRSENYYIYVNKKPRALPTIITQAQTVMLSQYQDTIDFENFYSFELNDYLAKLNIYYDGKEIKNNILEVENISMIYNIEITLTGEFGRISEILAISVLPYTEIEIRFNSSIIIKDSSEYIFSFNDFISEIIYYGIDAESCNFELLCDEETFVSDALSEGEHYLTINIWQDNILLKTETRWYNIIFASISPSISVTLINSESNIPQKTYNANIEDYFNIDFGTYDPNTLIFRFIYNDTSSPQSSFILRSGKNYITLQIIERLSEQELFRNEYIITCHYIANSEDIFNKLYLNDILYNINVNDVTIIKSIQLVDVKFTYSIKDGVIVSNFPESITLNPGLNQIQYNVEETDGTSYIATLNIYNLCYLDYYITSISYEEHQPQNNVFILDADTIFDINNLRVNYNDAEHIEISRVINELSDTILDVTLTGKYDGINIGSIVIRVYIGFAQPRLFEITTKIIGDSILYYGINEYGVELFAQSNANSIDFSMQFIDNKYSINQSVLSNLNYGVNNLSLTIIDSTTLYEYQYNIIVTLFPSNLFDSIAYDGNELTRTDNFYIVKDLNSLDENLISVSLIETYVPISCRNSQILFNDEVVGIEISLFYSEILIQKIFVAIENDNASIICMRNNNELQQIGNNLLTDSIRLRKSNSNNIVRETYYLKCVYPMTYIANEDFAYDEAVGYYITIDLSYLLKDNIGTYTHNVTFDVISVSTKITFTLQIEIEVYEVNEENAELIINVNSSSFIYFEEDELTSDSIIAYEEIVLDIFTENLTITIQSQNNYSLYTSDGTAAESLSVSLSHGNYGYYIQFQVGLNSFYLYDIIIYVQAYRNANGEIIETACVFEEQEIDILENAELQEINYNGVKHTVSKADKALYLATNTLEINARFYGYIANQNGFILKNFEIGNEGIIEIKDNCILLLMVAGDTIIPYAIIEVVYV